MRFLIVCLVSILSLGAFGQNKPLDIPEGISEKDFQTIASFKQNMAKHINPDPDSALYYIQKIRALSTQLNYAIGLFEADHLMAHYHRRQQQLDSAIVYFNLSLQKSHEINYNKGIAVSKNGLCCSCFFIFVHSVSNRKLSSWLQIF